MSKALISCLLSVILAGCGLDETLHRADKPVSREAAAKDVELPFPASARDVYYVVHSGGMQEFQKFVRFTVDAKELDGTVSTVLEDHDKKMGKRFTYLNLPLSQAPRSAEIRQLSPVPIPWWDPESITNGYYRGTTNGQPFYLWVDESRHIIYLCQTD